LGEENVQAEEEVEIERRLIIIHWISNEYGIGTVLVVVGEMNV
jgi:hypothetical protein